MPQLNKGFAKSKMNKDFDERIVPTGEYRDALNIQISTSDGSNVGSAQTLLGNVLMSNGMVPDGSTCVSSIAYGKEDKIYYFVAGPKYDDSQRFDTGCWKDYIIEYNLSTETFKYVFVDIYRAHFKTTQASIDREIFLDTSSVPISVVRREMLIDGYDAFNNHIIISDNTQDVEITDVNYSPTNSIDIYSTEVDYNTTFVPADTLLQCTERRLLNFDEDRYITGINIIDGMIFWTDNYSEPKKSI